MWRKDKNTIFATKIIGFNGVTSLFLIYSWFTDHLQRLQDTGLLKDDSFQGLIFYPLGFFSPPSTAGSTLFSYSLCFPSFHEKYSWKDASDHFCFWRTAKKQCAGWFKIKFFSICWYVESTVLCKNQTDSCSCYIMLHKIVWGAMRAKSKNIFKNN